MTRPHHIQIADAIISKHTAEGLKPNLALRNDIAAALDQAFSGYDGRVREVAELSSSAVAKAADALFDISRFVEAVTQEVERIRSGETRSYKEFWATWNSCNGIFDVFSTRAEAIANAEGKEWVEQIIPVRVCEEPRERWDQMHWLEDQKK